MTANQVAYAANVESIRHNRETEEISKRSNDIQAERNQIDRDYKTRVLDLQEAYNNTSLAMQEAQGNRKLDLQEQLNLITHELNTAEANYKQAMSEVAIRNSSISERNQQEMERYQKALNDLGYSKLDIEAQLANVRERQVEYEKQIAEDQIRIQDFNALVNKTRTDNEYSLGLIRAENEQVRNELQKELQEWQEATLFTNSVWEGVGTLLKVFTGRR